MKSVGVFFILFVMISSVCSMGRLQMPQLNSPLVKSLLPSVMGGKLDINQVADQALKMGLAGTNSTFDVSGLCLNHTKVFLKALVTGQHWALKMLDAMGKPASGVLEGDLKWLGSYDECFSVQASVNVSGSVMSPYKGQYCTANFQTGSGRPTLNKPGGASVLIGICMPNSCSAEDTKALLQTVMSLLPMNLTGLPDPIVTCQSQKLEFDTRAIVALTVCSIFGFLMVLATAYDVIVVRWLKPSSDVSPKFEAADNSNTKLSKDSNNISNGTADPVHITTFYNIGNSETSEAPAIPEKADLPPNGIVVQAEPPPKQTDGPYRPGIPHHGGKLGQILLSFSIYSNGLKILNTQQSSGVLTSVNGIRFVSMTWVIFCHSIGGTLAVASNTGAYLPGAIKRFTYMAIANAYVSVDTFFTLSGLLVSYLCLKEMKKMDGAKKFKWGMFYFHRFWRLTPPYMLWLVFYVCLTRYLSNGPTWSEETKEKDFCKDTWWKNLLYVNNLVDTDHQCMGWAWYLANDMQFFVVSPLMLIPLYYSPLLGTLACMVFMLVNFISVGITTANSHLNPELIIAAATGHAEDMVAIYIKPWCRIGPYAVGFLAGYILYRTKCKLNIPKVLNIIGWLIAVGVGFAIVYGVYDKTGIPQWNYHLSALYHATHRTAWGAAVCWVIIACATGNGGWINTLLSWKAIVPLSRLTYCAYLVHPVVHYVYYTSKRSLVSLSDMEESYMFIGNTVISYAVAFVVSLTFEAPMMGLEKALLGRGKNS